MAEENGDYHKFTRYLKESCWLEADRDVSFKYFPRIDSQMYLTLIVVLMIYDLCEK